MRTLSGGESTVLGSATYRTGLRVKVANGDGTLIDLSDYASSVKIDENIDQPVSQATVEFIRASAVDMSLAPLRTDSLLNALDDTVTYSPLVDAGRLITLEFYTIAIGATPVSGDYKLLFKGYVDSTDVAGPVISVVCRDEGGLLVDTYIEAPAVYAGGDSMQAYIQAILNANLASPPTLYTPVTPSFEMKPITEPPEPSSVMDYIQQVAALIGWDLRYRWDNGTSAFRLTLSEPDRANTTADYTFAKNRYIKVSKLELDRTNVRNVIEVRYGTAVPQLSFVAEDADSITRFGRRWFLIGEGASSQIDTLAEATVLGNNALSDLKDPLAEFQIERHLWWPAQLGDLYAFSDNDIHFNTTQKYAVVGIQHDFSLGNYRTTLTTRGFPAGGYLTWLSNPQPILPVFEVEVPPVISYRVSPTGVLTATVIGGLGTNTTRALARVDRDPTVPEIDAATGSPIGSRTGVHANLVTLKAGKRFYLGGRAYSASGLASVVARISDVWLGVGSTPGADVIIGDSFGSSTDIVDEVAFDEECAYCEVWTKEFTSNPGAAYPVENKGPAPTRVLSLGADAFVVGIAQYISYPINAPLNYLMRTYVPFDHLGKRGNLQNIVTRGSTGAGVPGGPIEDPGDIVSANLVLQLEADSLSLADNDPVASWTDLSGNAAHAVQATAGKRPLFKTNILNGLPCVLFDNVDDMLVAPVSSLAANPFTILVVYATRSTGTAQGRTIVGGTDSLTESFFLSSGWDVSNNKHLARTKWPGSGFIQDGSPVIDDFKVALYRRSPTTSGTGEYFVDGVSIGTETGDLVGHGPELALGGDGSTTPRSVGDCYTFLVWEWDGELTDDEVAQVFALASERTGIEVDPPPLGDPPDPPSNVVQTGASSSSIEWTVTMPAVAPDYIRITTGIATQDVAVSVAGGAAQVIEVVVSIPPGTGIFTRFQCVDNGLLSTFVDRVGTTDPSSGTLDAPTITDVAYSPGDQAFVVTLTAGANNPSATTYKLEYDEVPSVGYVEDVAAANTDTALVSPAAQLVGDFVLRNFKVWATMTGWTNSARSAAELGTAPPAFG